MQYNYTQFHERPQFIELHDELNVRNSQRLTKLIPDGETIYFSGKIVKINDRSKAQKRILIITDRGVYNIHPRNTVISKVAYWLSPSKSLRRRIGAPKIDSVTISTNPVSDQFVLHIKGERDYLFDGVGKRERILKALTQLYCPVFGNHFTFYVKEEADLRKFRTTEEDFKAGVQKKPQEGAIQISQACLGRGLSLSWIIENHKQFIEYSKPQGCDLHSGASSSNGFDTSMQSLPDTQPTTPGTTSIFKPLNQNIYISQIPPQIPYTPYQAIFDRSKLIQGMDDITLTSSVVVQVQKNPQHDESEQIDLIPKSKNVKMTFP